MRAAVAVLALSAAHDTRYRRVWMANSTWGGMICARDIIILAVFLLQDLYSSGDPILEPLFGNLPTFGGRAGESESFSSLWSAYSSDIGKRQLHIDGHSFFANPSGREGGKQAGRHVDVLDFSGQPRQIISVSLIQCTW